ncbi:MAG TPA: hypothetical protein VMV34_06640, partial [Terriglobia bacterium]|nr:hypothetical protein [Terriglobia bacterium]
LELFALGKVFLSLCLPPGSGGALRSLLGFLPGLVIGVSFAAGCPGGCGWSGRLPRTPAGKRSQSSNQQ